MIKYIKELLINLISLIKLNYVIILLTNLKIKDRQ